MRCVFRVTLGTVLLASSLSHASPISGFEVGLSGWDYMGDVSTQSSAIGLTPTQGNSMAFISTMCDRNNPPMHGRCNTTTNEHPYSGVSSSPSSYAREFLGLPSSGIDFVNAMPSVNTTTPGGGTLEIGTVGESGAMKLRFYAQQAGVISFDWNRIGRDGDTAYFSLWSDDPLNTARMNDWIYYANTFEGTFRSSGVDLCSRYYNDGSEPPCRDSAYDFYNYETGWSTKSAYISQAGWYWIGFGLGEVAEGTAPTVLALDNLRFELSEPGTVLLLITALAAMAIRSNPKAARTQRSNPKFTRGRLFP